MIPIWHAIKGYEGLYEVNDSGQVRRTPKPLKPSYMRGYAYVTLCKNGKSTTKYITRLVAKAFIPNPQKKEQVNHIDGNPSNDHVDNLEWATPKENTQHAIRTGLRTVSPTVRGNFKGKNNLLPDSK